MAKALFVKGENQGQHGPLEQRGISPVTPEKPGNIYNNTNTNFYSGFIL